MDRKTREELNKMSKEVFGSSSRWQKLVNKGIAEPYERQREVMVPKANGAVMKKTFTDKKSVVRHMTVEEVTNLMKDMLKVREARLAHADAITPVAETTSSAPSVQVLDNPENLQQNK